jgi:hypothetical protein
MPTVYIGAGAGFAGDRTDAAGPVVAALARCDGPRFLIFETLAERTLAQAQVERRQDPARGYNPALPSFITPILRECLDSGVRIVSNFGAANPRAAGELILAIAANLGCQTPKVAIVEGDDLSGVLAPDEFARREVGGTLLSKTPPIVAANAYIGAAPIAEALDQGADIVVTGRVADPSLVLGPLIHGFRWSLDDWDRLAAGTLVGHLLECGAQVTGGYFADPGVKDVPGMDNLGYPIAEVRPDGTFVITKPEGTGGIVDRRTVTEQILYEIHDPAAYLTPDVVLDLTQVELEEIGPNRILVTGARGKPRPGTLKATVCIDGGLLAEAEISYAGPNAVARARLAVEIIRARMALRAPGLQIRADAIGVVSVLGDTRGEELAGQWTAQPPEDVRVRFAAQGPSADAVEMLLGEVEALYCAGPAGGAGVRRRVTPRLTSASCHVERSLVPTSVSFLGETR